VLRQDQAAFGTVSVDAGPVLAPFLLTAAAIPEIEPNNSRAQAQRISGATVISGNISVPGDVDYFQFSGRRGEVVTALVSTASLNSALDSILFLLNPDETVFAENDENGLLFQSDSFLQAVLPADGTYYLVVTDYRSRRHQRHISVARSVPDAICARQCLEARGLGGQQQKVNVIPWQALCRTVPDRILRSEGRRIAVGSARQCT
jgi:hypothetical protein